MNRFSSETLRYIGVLSSHMSKIVAPDGSVVPLTEEFCEQALAKIQTGSVCGLWYDLKDPWLEGLGDFVLVINRDGTIDCGSRESVEKVQWAKANMTAGKEGH